MKNTKFVVKVMRSGTHAAEYVERIDRDPHPNDNPLQAGPDYGEIHGYWDAAVSSL